MTEDKHHHHKDKKVLSCEHGKRRVSTRDRVIMLLLTLGLAVIFLRPFIVQQSKARADSFLDSNLNKKAITHYKRALVLDPNSPGIHSILGFAYMREKQLDDALNAYKKAIKLGAKDKQTYLEAGLVSFRKKDFDKAAYYFKKAAEIDSKDLHVKSLEAASYEKAGKIGRAIAVCQEILKEDPDFKPAKERLERLLSKKENN